MSRPKLIGLAGAALATGLAGCNDEYLSRRHTLSPAAGDAVRANIAAHVIDPWPRNAANTNIVFSGERMANTVRVTQRGPTQPGAAGGAAGGGAHSGDTRSGETR